MPPNFKPLLAGATSPESAAGRPTSHRDLKSQFKPLGVSGDNTPAAVIAAAQAAHAHSAPASGATHLGLTESGPRPSSAVTQVIRDGDRITHIEIRCGCGEIITLECAYAPAG